ncbi:MAG: 1-acyl-sn-glycerol-3-phosphate acyltransferase [Bacteroidales bacterium]|nr:1-acyl-sn-glycerol-3-phosphate acyltransferase [Bacteroidales bacterium]
MTTAFDDIRPYFDSEIPAAMSRIVDTVYFPQVAKMVYPDTPSHLVRERVLGIASIHQWQSSCMTDAVQRIIADTSAGLTSSGFELLTGRKGHLIVSNHRDITLDAFLLQHLLLSKRRSTTFIVFGDNLLTNPLVRELFLTNKLVRMPRGGNRRQFYESLSHLSAYIHHLIVEQGQSVWIAQRNGRAKDGRDMTSEAVIKMLCMNHPDHPQKALANLNILSMAASYEWDPCDVLKTNELYRSRREAYVKADGEDLNSIVTGIGGYKGRMHIALSRPLRRTALMATDSRNLSTYVAKALDRSIHRIYHLMPTNYLAYDMLHGTHRHQLRYSPSTQHAFLQRLDTLPTDEHRDIFLRIYANPVEASLNR